MMKPLRSISLLALLPTVFSASTYAQTSPASATWSLAADPTAVVSGSITATDQALGSAISGTSFGSTTYGVSGTGSTSIHNQNYARAGSTVYLPTIGTDTVVNPNSYVEYTVSASGGNYLQINNVSLATVGGGSGLVKVVARYSLDNFATFSYLAGPANPASYNTTLYNASGATSYAATQLNPVSLINGSSTASDFNGSEMLTFSNLSINVAPGQTFALRLYAYVAATSGNRYLAEKDVVISGKTAATVSALPLDFLSFNAQLLKGLSKQVKLSWTTANESNTDSFTIERSTDGVFSPIGQLPAKNVSGVQSYFFIDANPVAGTAYYRLSQTDKDGASKTYAKIVEVNNAAGLNVAVYPNPAAEVINVSHPVAGQSARISILKLDGTTVASVTAPAGAISSRVDVSSLASGYYLLSFEDGTAKQVVRFVKK